MKKFISFEITIIRITINKKKWWIEFIKSIECIKELETKIYKLDMNDKNISRSDNIYFLIKTYSLWENFIKEFFAVNKNLYVTKSDKGDSEKMNTLSDESTYKKLDKNPIMKIQNKKNDGFVMKIFYFIRNNQFI